MKAQEEQPFILRCKRKLILMSKTYKPGEIVPVSGLYTVVSPNGQTTNKRVTSVKGEPFPPTDTANQAYKLDEPTN
jgi:YjzC-like protein